MRAYVYIAESPLYEINTKDRHLFCLYRTGKGRHFWRRSATTKYTIQRSKGLGRKRARDDVADHHESGDPPADQGDAGRCGGNRREVFDLLLGDNLAGRKEHIAAHGAEYLDRSGRILMTDGHPHASETGHSICLPYCLRQQGPTPADTCFGNIRLPGMPQRIG